MRGCIKRMSQAYDFHYQSIIFLAHVFLHIFGHVSVLLGELRFFTTYFRPNQPSLFDRKLTESSFPFKSISSLFLVMELLHFCSES